VNYRVEIYDTWNRRVALFDEVPLLRATRSAVDRPDILRGILPGPIADLSHGYYVRLYVEDRLFVEAPITRLAPQWSDTRKLVLDRFVYYHEVIEFEAVREALDGNAKVSRAFVNRPIHDIVRAVINAATGPVHYLVPHNAYPDGALREYYKFISRKTAANELGVGGITQGQWVDAARINATGAYAKDGDTIAGLVVDGVAWPDLRLMMVDAEETSRNSHAESIHGEVAGWTDADYNASGYKLKADAARVFLQGLIDTRGIDFIELNPHRDASGAFDDRIDVYGRYLGFVYGDSECFNAALVETGHAAVYLYDEGKFHVPEMELKDYYSYTGVNSDSIESTAATLLDYDVSAGVFEVLTALAYAAEGYIWSLAPGLTVTFRRPVWPNRVVFFDRVQHAVTLGSDSTTLGNALVVRGDPIAGMVDTIYYNGPSIDEYGFRLRFLEYFSLANLEDAGRLAAGLLEDIAYPARSGRIGFLAGEPNLHCGDIVEIRGDDVRRVDREVSGEWADRFSRRLAARVASITHEFRGRLSTTDAELTSPLRSVDSPLSFIVRSQPSASAMFQFRLDEATVGLDLGYHLD
jgi:endonuclease YncB( thermonuclease family)